MSFVHLHVHDIYSFGEAIGNPKEYTKTAKHYKQPALAITNNGNLCGAFNFHQACTEVGIKPILGQEFYIAENDDMKLRDSPKQRRLVLLAKNQKGWNNLIKLSSLAYLEGRYFKPRIDSKVLAKYSEGLIGLSAGIDGVAGSYWSMGEERKALEISRRYNSILKGNFYLEVLPIYLQQQIEYNRFLISLSEASEIKVVAANCCYYVHQSQAKYHPYLIMIKNNIRGSEFGRVRQLPETLYLMARDEMLMAFEKQGFDSDEINPWLDETLKISDQVEEIKFEKTFKLPAFLDFKEVKAQDLEIKNENGIRQKSLFE